MGLQNAHIFGGGGSGCMSYYLYSLDTIKLQCTHDEATRHGAFASEQTRFPFFHRDCTACQ